MNRTSRLGEMDPVLWSSDAPPWSAVAQERTLVLGLVPRRQGALLPLPSRDHFYWTLLD